jgi:hypothetical protein
LSSGSTHRNQSGSGERFLAADLGAALDPEQRHYAVADELVDASSRRFDRTPDRGKIAVEDKYHVAGGLTLGERGEAAYVNEKDRNFALAVWQTPAWALHRRPFLAESAGAAPSRGARRPSWGYGKVAVPWVVASSPPKKNERPPASRLVRALNSVGTSQRSIAILRAHDYGDKRWFTGIFAALVIPWR